MKKAFTLVELVVVLAVIAIVAHLLVRELGNYREQRFLDAADKQLDEIRSAVWSIDSDGVPVGFLADMGRLPKDLSELWIKPDDAKSYNVANIAGKAFVPSGWRGPYLKLPIGKTELYDPWGNKFAETDSAGLERVFKDSETGFITNICHYGASAQTRGRRDVALVPDGGLSSSLVVAVEGENIETIYVYGPDGRGGVTNWVHAVGNNGYKFEDLTPGTRILWCATKGMRSVRVLPGENPPYIIKE